MRTEAGNPRVSILMPSLNVADYIGEALESVVAQTMRDIEIICIDAGSTDGTLEVIKRFADGDGRIRIIHSDVKSYGLQMNLGLKAAKGEYVAIVETDDAILPTMCERMYAVATANAADIVKADYVRFSGELSDSECERTVMPCTQNPDLYGKTVDPRDDRRALPFTIICGNIYRRSFLESENIRFNETPGASYQDIGFFMQTTLLARRIYFLNEHFYLYRRDNPNSSINSTGKAFAVCREFEFIRARLMSREDVEHDFSAEYGREMFYSYWSTLHRIGAGLRADFIMRFSDDLRAAFKRGELQRSGFSKANWQRILEIMTMPLAFLDKVFGPSEPPSEKLVVALTSWPKRIKLVYKVIDNMFRQTRRPDKVVLYLSRKQFPDKKLPHLLTIRLERDPRFEVRYTADIGSHKKYYRAFKDFPDAAIVLVDDDIVYPNTMLRDLMVQYRRSPHAVTCLRSHTISMTRKRTFSPYLDWMKERKIVNEASPLILATTGGGTIFPPNSLPPEAFDIDGIRKLAPTADDLWLKWHLLANRVPVKYITAYGKARLETIPGTQSAALVDINVGENNNDRIWNGIVAANGDEAELLTRLLYECYAFRFPMRVAPVVSWPVRKLRGGILCLHENGLRYTFFHSFEKLFGKLNEICRRLSRSKSYWEAEKARRKRSVRALRSQASEAAASKTSGQVPPPTLPPIPPGSVAVSVLIPVYNAEKTLPECLDSILDQTLKQIEVVCVNDGSTDGSLEILRQYKARDSRVRVFVQANAGASAARNYALERAKGEFVAFADPDDLLPDPQSLAMLYAAARRHGLNAACGSLERMDEDTGKVDRPPHWQFTVEGVRNWRDNPFDFCYQLFVFKRDMLLKGNVRFPPVARYQDPPFMVRAMAAAGKFYAMPVIAYRYRVGHKAVNWKARDFRKLRDMLRSMADVVRFAKANGIPQIVEQTRTRLLKDYADVLRGIDVASLAEYKELIKELPPAT